MRKQRVHEHSTVNIGPDYLGNGGQQRPGAAVTDQHHGAMTSVHVESASRRFSEPPIVGRSLLDDSRKRWHDDALALASQMRRRQLPGQRAYQRTMNKQERRRERIHEPILHIGDPSGWFC
ncbi:hypothetical protein Atai01_14700 [Amycolatopsis taiwanensis]|uniref:Uncharacterized protein n=1 Tax=Amycolatopsis taiwanensis TaxID=342230 RepID=A0A9W6VFU8_9PSEU|nr:hypothetical protein Atai01_14700 [Amycolatopsis taiwanensis]